MWMIYLSSGPLIDPELGYPLKSSEAQNKNPQDNANPDAQATETETAQSDNNLAEARVSDPGVIDTTHMPSINEEDVDLEGVSHESDCPGVGGLGGGGEYD